jgi:hypothetical protein
MPRSIQILHREIIDLDSYPCITAFKMDMHQETDNSSDTYAHSSQIVREVPLYHLKLGVARNSSGIECAEKCGKYSAVALLPLMCDLILSTCT